MDNYNDILTQIYTGTTHTGNGNGTSEDRRDASETTNWNPNDALGGMDSGLTSDRRADKGSTPQTMDPPRTHGRHKPCANRCTGEAAHEESPHIEANSQGEETDNGGRTRPIRGTNDPPETNPVPVTGGRDSARQNSCEENTERGAIESALDEIQRQLEMGAPAHVLDEFMRQRTMRNSAMESPSRTPTQNPTHRRARENDRTEENTAADTRGEQTEDGDFDWDAPIVPLASGLPDDIEQQLQRDPLRPEGPPRTREGPQPLDEPAGGSGGEEKTANARRTPTGNRRQKAKRGALKIASLNIRGGGTTNTQEKWKHLNQAVRENTLDIAVVQETHLNDQRRDEIQQLFDARLQIWNSGNPDRPNAEGIAFILNKATTHWKEARVTNVIEGRAIHMSLPWGNDDELNILGVYAPNAPGENARFWSTLTEEIRRKKLNRPDIMMGDLNIVEDSLDRLPPHQDNPTAVEALSDIKNKYGLCDGWRQANPTRLAYSFRMTDIQSRIDRIYVNERLLGQCHQWQISHTAIKTDHKIVSCEVLHQGTPYIGKGRYTIPVILLENRKLMQKIMVICKDHQEAMSRVTPESRTAEVNAQTLHKKFKDNLVRCIRDFAKEHMSKYDREIKALEKDLKKTLQEDDPDEERKRLNAAMIDERITQLERLRHTKNRDNVATKAMLEGETMGRYWIQQNREKKPRDTIPALRAPDRPPTLGDGEAEHQPPAHTGQTARRSEEMADLARNYHERIQVEGLPKAEGAEERITEVLANVTARISQKEKNNLAKYMSEQEVEEAIVSMPNGKAAGMDGIAHELWRTLLKRQKSDEKAKRPTFNLVEVLTKMYNDIERHGVVAATNFAEGWMCPIYKKGDKTDVSNYRPITVLNTDYKIFTKVLSIRLTEAAPGIIHSDQAGFMKGRRIEDQTELMKLIIHKCETQGERGAIICLDQEKAYDKISHAFLWESLRKFDLPEHFIRSVQTLYGTAETVVVINGVISSPFRIIRGVRQGDPLSCLLFNVAIESLAQMLRKSGLKGFDIKGREENLIVSLFADDTTVYLSEEDKLESVQDTLDKWCQASGAKFNVPKTIIIPLGSKEYRETVVDTRKLHPSHECIPTEIRIAREGEPIRALGAYIGNGVPEEAIWTPTVEKVTRDLERWNRSHPTQDGKRLIVNMVVGGRTQYLTRVQGMPTTVENILTKRIREFMWNGSSTPPVALSTLRMTQDEGGKKLLDIKVRNEAIELRKLGAFLNFGRERPTWAEVADELLATNIRRGGGTPDASTLSNPFLQGTKTVLRAGNTTLPQTLVRMIKAGKQHGVAMLPTNPSKEVLGAMPAWHHIGVRDGKRNLANTETHRCLRAVHGIQDVSGLQRLIEVPNDPEHAEIRECECQMCTQQKARGCSNPANCRKAGRKMLDDLRDEWDPRKENYKGGNNEENTDEIRTFDKRGRREDSVKECIRVFTAPTPSTKGRPPEDVDYETTVVVTMDSRNVPDHQGGHRIGWGATITGPGGKRTMGGRLPSDYENLNTKAGKLVALAAAITNVEEDANILVVCDSKEQLDNLTTKVDTREDRGWVGATNVSATHSALDALRNRKGVVSLKTGRQDATENREMAERRAVQGETALAESLQKHPDRGARLIEMTQAELYRGIILSGPRKKRRHTTINLDRIRCATWEVTNKTAEDEDIWRSVKTPEFSKKYRAFLWRVIHDGYKIGDYWNDKKDLEWRGKCKKCDTTETLEHILLECESVHARRLWQLAESLWARKSDRPWPTLSLGVAIGCGLITMADEKGRIPKGENRLYHILVSETIYLLWTMRCWWKIEKKEEERFAPTKDEVENKWWAVLNRRLKTDCLMTNRARYGRKAIDKDLVMMTWSKLLDNEELLGDDWHKDYSGVLVGRGEVFRKGRNR